MPCGRMVVRLSLTPAAADGASVAALLLVLGRLIVVDDDAMVLGVVPFRDRERK